MGFDGLVVIAIKQLATHWLAAVQYMYMYMYMYFLVQLPLYSVL